MPVDDFTKDAILYDGLPSQAEDGLKSGISGMKRYKEGEFEAETLMQELKYSNVKEFDTKYGTFEMGDFAEGSMRLRTSYINEDGKEIEELIPESEIKKAIASQVFNEAKYIK